MAIAAAFALIGRSSARAEPFEPELRSPPIVLDVLQLAIAAPEVTFTVRAGAHGWVRERLSWGVHVLGLQAFRQADINHNGTDDYDPDSAGPHFELQSGLGWALWQRVGDIRIPPYGPDPSGPGQLVAHRVDSISAIAGARLAFGDETVAAAAAGVRLARREPVVDEYERKHTEMWVQARALLYVPAAEPGFDAEIVWMPRSFGVGVFFDFAPQLDDDAVVDCTQGLYETCETDYALSSFNPIPETAHWQLGVRIHLAYAL